MLPRKRRSKTSCAVTLVITHMTALLLDGAAHVSRALTGKMLPTSPCTSSQSGKQTACHARCQLVSVCGREARKGEKLNDRQFWIPYDHSVMTHLHVVQKNRGITNYALYEFLLTGCIITGSRKLSKTQSIKNNSLRGKTGAREAVSL